MFTLPDPLRVADGTYLVRPLVGRHHVNSLIVVGAEPMLVDTGTAALRDEWVEQTFSLVDPGDVRWIFLSHHDPDHTGNLAVALELCRDAVVVTDRCPDEQRCAVAHVPPGRRVHLADGEVLDLADRRLVAVRPPVFDAPSTRGLYDTATGVYWAADAFGASVPGVVDHVDDLPREQWLAAFDEHASLRSPWLAVADTDRFGAWVDRVAELDPTVIAGAHGPLVSGTAIDAAIHRARRLPEAAAQLDERRPSLVTAPARAMRAR